MKIFILFKIVFFLNLINGDFGYVLNNCSDLSISKKKNNFDYYIYSEEKPKKNFRVAQVNKGKILKINNNPNSNSDKDFISVFDNSFFYLKNGKLENKYFIEKKNIKNRYLNCFFFNKNLKKINIKINKCFLEKRSKIYLEKKFIKKNQKKIRKKIINFLESLTNKKNKIIPYSFGGTTIWNSLPKKFFIRKILNNQIIYISKKNKLKNEEKSGIDCSGLINLTLRLFGIPFHLRNTETFKLFIKKINNYEELQDGDLLWIPGHIFFIDKENNILYE